MWRATKLGMATAMVAVFAGACDEPDGAAGSEAGEAAGDSGADEAPEKERRVVSNVTRERPAWMLGAWQIGSPEVADDRAETYRFFEDGLFVYHRGVTEACEPGVVARVGLWYLEDDELVLGEERRLEIEGGERRESDDGHCHRVGDKSIATIHELPRPERILIRDCSARELEAYASHREEHDGECRRFDFKAHWTTIADLDSWRDDWSDWFENADERREPSP